MADGIRMTISEGVQELFKFNPKRNCQSEKYRQAFTENIFRYNSTLKEYYESTLLLLQNNLLFNCT